MLRSIPRLARKRKLTAGGRVRGKSGHCLLLGLLEFLDKGGEDLEEIADDSVACDFEDGRVLLLIAAMVSEPFNALRGLHHGQELRLMLK